MNKPRILSGVQPSGRLTIGNYIGALNNWTKLQDTHEALYCIVDMHSMTQKIEPAMLRKLTYETLAIYLACGLDPQKNVLFIQSHVPAHAELSWILGCMTYMGELNRMTQFKDKSKKNVDNINAGLYTYPVLMAADILLYQTNLVPVGEDQRQHLELTRDIAQRFNGRYSETFAIPEAFHPKVGARIMSLQEPESKMSKSDDNENASIYITDTPEAIVRKIKRSVTDMVGVVQLNSDQPGIKNLMTIHSALSGISFDQLTSTYEGRGYGDFKNDVAEVIVESLRPAREEYARLMEDKAYLQTVYKDGAQRARHIAMKTMRKVYKKIGFVEE